MLTSQHGQVRTFTITTGLVCGLAVVFNVFFSFEKHDPVLVAVNPFTTDPYDAVGSLAIQAAVIFALLAVLRTFQQSRANTPAQAQQVVLVRAQLAATLAVLLALVADAVALARHPSMWIGSVAGTILCLLVVGLCVISLVVAATVQHTTRAITLPTISGRWLRAIIICAASAALVVFYPEDITNNPGIHGAILTAFVGGVLLVIPLWALLTALSPYRLTGSKQTTWRWLRRYGSWVLLVALVGMVVGLLVFAREGMVEGVPHNSAKIAHGALVYMGLEGSGIVIGYLFLCTALEPVMNSSRMP
jgi:Ca2+/Na+ antiporter